MYWETIDGFLAGKCSDMILVFKGLSWLLCGEGTTGHQEGSSGNGCTRIMVVELEKSSGSTEFSKIKTGDQRQKNFKKYG